MEHLLYCTCTYQLCECLQTGTLWFMAFTPLTIHYYSSLWLVISTLESTFYQRTVWWLNRFCKGKPLLTLHNLLKESKTVFQKRWTASLELPAPRLHESWLSGTVSIYCPLLVSSLNLMFQTWLVYHLSHRFFAICWQCKWYSTGRTDLKIVTGGMKCHVLNCWEVRMLANEVLRSWTF